jgi:hypothetical protein
MWLLNIFVPTVGDMCPQLYFQQNYSQEEYKFVWQ